MNVTEKKVDNTKKCPKCKSYKEFNLFYKNRSTRDGLSYNCRECCKELSKVIRLRYKKINEGSKVEVKLPWV